MQHPTLSIVIPVYNAAHSISTITNIILNQSFSDFELLLINDGSTDNSLDIIQAFAKKDQRVRVYSQQNAGPSNARNLGLLHAQGKYIQFYDSDDTIDSEAITNTMQSITKSGADLLVSGWRIVYDGKNRSLSMTPKAAIIEEDIIDFTLASLGHDGTLYNLWNKLFRADIIRRHKITFQDDIRFGEDLLFALDYLRHTKKIQIIPTITYEYFTGQQSNLFRTSSIVPIYRHANDKALYSFVGTATTEKTQDLFQWLRWRWLLSYWMLVSQSNKPFREKLALIQQGVDCSLNVARSSTHIGRNNYILENILSRVKKVPLIAIFFAALLSSIKKLSLFFK